MRSELPQSVLAVTGKNGGVMTAFLAAGLTSIANLFEAIQPIIGGITSIALFIMALIIFKKKDKLFAKEIELKEAQIRAISERKQEREEFESATEI